MWEKVWTILVVVALLIPVHYAMNRIFWSPEEPSPQETRCGQKRTVVLTLIDAVADFFRFWFYQIGAWKIHSAENSSLKPRSDKSRFAKLSLIERISLVPI
jgi:hypothetical protein